MGVPHSAEIWQTLEDQKSTINVERATPGLGDLIVLGPTLPDNDEPHVAGVVVRRLDRDATTLRWRLNIRPAPSGEPPQTVKQSDEKLGGRGGSTRLLESCLPLGAPGSAMFRVRLAISGSLYACPALVDTPLEREGRHAAAAQLGRDTRIEQVGYRFVEGGINGIEEVSIVYGHQENVFSVGISANGLLRLKSPTWLPYATEVTDLVLSTLFRQKEALP